METAGMSAEWLLATMLLGFVAYGLSIYYYIELTLSYVFAHVFIN